MRGDDIHQDAMFSYLSPEARVPKDHPLRPLRQMVNQALRELSRDFQAMYSREGRPSIPPEKLLLQVLYTIRSERLLMEQLDYNLLLRWFVGLSMDDKVWDHSVFSKNRERFLRSDLAAAFFGRIKEQAAQAGLLSDEHFTVDGTLIEAWASLKSFRPKDTPPPSGGSGRNPEVDFHGERRLNQTAERQAAEDMVEAIPGRHRITVGGDKAYDTHEFVQSLRALKAVPHVAQSRTGRASAIDGHTTRHPGYDISQRLRKRVEEIFGWMKTVGNFRKTRHRGRQRVGWMFTLTAAAYNLVRIRNLVAAASP